MYYNSFADKDIHFQINLPSISPDENKEGFEIRSKSSTPTLATLLLGTTLLLSTGMYKIFVSYTETSPQPTTVSQVDNKNSNGNTHQPAKTNNVDHDKKVLPEEVPPTDAFHGTPLPPIPEETSKENDFTPEEDDFTPILEILEIQSKNETENSGETEHNENENTEETELVAPKMIFEPAPFENVGPLDDDNIEIGEQLTETDKLPEFRKPTEDELRQLLYPTDEKVLIPSLTLKNDTLVSNDHMLQLSSEQLVKLKTRFKELRDLSIDNYIYENNISNPEEIKEYEAMKNEPVIIDCIISLDFQGKAEVPFATKAVYFAMTNLERFLNEEEQLDGMVIDINSEWEPYFNGSHTPYVNRILEYKKSELRGLTQDELDIISKKIKEVYKNNEDNIYNILYFNIYKNGFNNNSRLIPLVYEGDKLRLITNEYPLDDNIYKDIKTFFNKENNLTPVATISLSDEDHIIIAKKGMEDNITFKYFFLHVDYDHIHPEIDIKPYDN